MYLIDDIETDSLIFVFLFDVYSYLSLYGVVGILLRHYYILWLFLYIFFRQIF